MENDAGLAGMVKVKAMVADNIKERFGGEDAVMRRLDVVTGDITFLMATGRGKYALFRMILAVRQVL